MSLVRVEPAATVTRSPRVIGGTRVLLAPVLLPVPITLPLASLLAVSALLPAARFSWPDPLVVAGCGVRAAVPLALMVALSEGLPHLRGIPVELAEPLAAQLLALMFVVVLSDLLLQTVVMRRQLDAIEQR